MRLTLAIVGLICGLLTGAASAATTKDFLYRCSMDKSRCAAKIKDVHSAIENPPRGQRAPAQLCFPSTVTDEDLADAVTSWIDDQVPALDNKNDFDSIAAALYALYSCGGIR